MDPEYDMRVTVPVLWDRLTNQIVNNESSDIIIMLNEKFNQFYMASVYKSKFKGLHVHPYKVDTLHCIYGKICVAFYPEVVEKPLVDSTKIEVDDFIFIELGNDNHKTISFPSKYPHGFFGIDDTSLTINYRVPAWAPEDNHQYDIVSDELVEKLIEKYVG